MAESVMYHEGNRQLQDRFDSRRISDRLEEKLMRKEFSADDKQFIESLPYFFLATADAEGRPDCSFKGGAPGFVRITGPSEIAFPDYDGNGMFKSLGNIVANADVGLLFIALHDKPRRLRVNGSASVIDNDPLLAETVGAQLIVRVTARAVSGAAWPRAMIAHFPSHSDVKSEQRRDARATAASHRSTIALAQLGGMSEWLKERGCKPRGYAYAGSNPAPPIPPQKARSSGLFLCRRLSR